MEQLLLPVAMFVLIAISMSCTCATMEPISLPCNQVERASLLNFKHKLSTKSFKELRHRLESWVGEDCCNWKGVGCDNITGHITKLDLRDEGYNSYGKLVQKPSQTRQFFSHASRAFENPISGNEIFSVHKWRQKSHVIASVNPGIYASQLSPCITRSLASASGSEQGQKNQNKTKTDLSTVEDPFDAPTYHIPEKPVTFTEGASYSLVILAGLGIAGAAAYGVFKELIFQPKEYKIFDKALARVQDDSQVRVRIGTPIKGYGQETRNRAARQKIPNRIWTDEDGVEHVQILFHIRGPHGAGQARCEMFKDNTDKQWKYTYLTVDILSPTPVHLILESFFAS